MKTSSRARTAAAMSVGALLLQAGCSAEGPGMPSAPDLPEVRHSVAGGYTVVNAQLRPVTSGATAYGHVQLKFLPPNPVFPNDPINVSISGTIFNSDGDDIATDAGIYFGGTGLGDGGIFVVPLTLPPNPVRATIDETITISAALATELRSSDGYVIRYGSIAGSLVGGRAQPSPPPI